MSLNEMTQSMLPVVENELKSMVGMIDQPALKELHDMLAYHLGWIGEGAGVKARGKRIRPLLVLLCAAASGGKWRNALPAAAAIELLHNFSLIHDDIQDQSPLRRNRPTLWKKWGIAQAINAGDLMFSLANTALLRLNETSPSETVLQAGKLFQSACTSLTQGQYLDISYETQKGITLEAYWLMIEGKTAALIAACCGMGALIGGADTSAQEAYYQFGRNLGLAFQVQDDILGIWGESETTGKSTESDLVAGKKTLPVIYGLQQKSDFTQRWLAGPITAGEVPELIILLESTGAKTYAQEKADRLTNQALAALDKAVPNKAEGKALIELANKLLNRSN
jgi:geranylgeranyl diphosphate synthase type I